MARSTYEGMKMYSGERRPFVLTRAGFIGSQRYAATWTGDNLANWEHLHMSISMVLQLVNFSSRIHVLDRQFFTCVFTFCLAIHFLACSDCFIRDYLTYTEKDKL